jgi:adenylate cyclase
MASVFLSYAREDAAKAKALAKCLERAGHSVWWDRHIHGGSEYADEIETALRDAEVIVVLWSDASIRSAWVRDEAAEGRDSGRLVPLLLDASSPPLGFRQLQTIDLSGWSGRGNPPHAQEIVAAIDARSGKKQAKRPSATAARPVPRRAVLAGLGILGALLAAFGAWWLLGSRSEASTTPVLAVLPFSDLSPEGDKAYLAEGVAEAILSGLAKEPGIKVIGRSSAKQLQDAGGAAPEMRRAMGITHVLEGSARSIGDQLRMSVRLVDASDGQQIWAEEYSRRLDNIFAVQDEIGRAVAQKLRGSFRGTVATQPVTKADIYALYLAARSKMRDRRLSSLHEALRLARKVIETDPRYGPGHAIYAELVMHLSAGGYGTIPTGRAREIARRHAREAIRLAPDSAEGYAALGLTAQDESSIEPLSTAIRLDPARAELRQWLGHSYDKIGRGEEALKQFEAAVDMDPLWVPGIMMLAYTLAASERYDEAERAIARFERRGGSRAVAAKVRGDVESYRGDFSESARLTDLALKLDPEVPQADLSAGWYYFMLGLHDRAAAASKQLPRYTRLLVSGEHELLLREVRSAGPAVWKEPDPEAAIAALAIARDWDAIVALHDSNRAAVAALCDDPEQVAPAIALAAALKAKGRSADNRRLLQCVRALLDRHGKGRVRSAYLPACGVDLTWAEVHALEGRSDLAFPLLERSVNRCIRAPYGRGILAFEAFDALKNDPRYARLDARLKQLIARDRAEAMANLRRAA